MFDLMDEMSELVYVVDINTYDLLFINSAGKKTYGVDQLATGQKCYKIIQGRDTPCEFCTTPLLSTDSFYTWEISNEFVGRHYLLKDKLIDWEGKHARLEIAFDITAQEMQKIELQNTAKTNAALLNCLKTLYENDASFTALNEILKIIGTLLESERTYIFEIKDGETRFTNEWHAQGYHLQDTNGKWLDFTRVSQWKESFEKNQCVIINDVESLFETAPIEYHLLKQRRVKRLVVVPLRLDGKLSSFMGVCNPPAEKLENVSLLLDTLGYFIASYMQRHKDKKRLEKLSYYDILTGLFNRNAFMRDVQILSQALSEPLGVIYLNVNSMKEINNHYGHEYGDVILCKVALLAQKNCSNDDVYRIGGDEFVAICQGMTEPDFEVHVRALKEAFKKDNASHVAIGHRWSNYRYDIDSIVLEASEQMYTDKKAYYYSQAAPKRYRHENDDILNLTKPGVLQDTLQNGKFVVYIQPKVSISSRALIGAEALVRLISPEGSLIPPDEFIPLLEETRLISMIDFFVFENICVKIREWLAEGRKVIPISVNFSRYTLTEEEFCTRLSQIWERFQIPQSLIEIELTERMSEEESDLFLEVAANIRELGFIIAIDDFGVKHANVSLFTQMKFDVLKIDKILISNLQENATAQIVLQSISDICRRMGIQLIVEGIETEEQLGILARLRCEGAQGYLFDKPIPTEDFEQKYMPL